MKKFVISLISIYQKTISPDHGFFPILRFLGRCRHYPSCSEYAKQSIAKYGLLKGIKMGLRRLSTCHPWSG